MRKILLPAKIIALLITIASLINFIWLASIRIHASFNSTYDININMHFDDDPSVCVNSIKSVIVSPEALTENDTGILTVSLQIPPLHNESGGYAIAECSTTISVSAPGFSLDPPVSEKQVTLSINKPTSNIIWTLTPIKIGSRVVLVNEKGSNGFTKGVAVTNWMGLSFVQSQIVSALIAFFGSAVTLPWLLEQYKKRTKKEKKGRR